MLDGQLPDLDREVACCSLSRQHDTVRAVQYSVGNISGLGPSGAWVLHHGLQHLCGRDHWLACLPQPLRLLLSPFIKLCLVCRHVTANGVHSNITDHCIVDAFAGASGPWAGADTEQRLLYTVAYSHVLCSNLDAESVWLRRCQQVVCILGSFTLIQKRQSIAFKLQRQTQNCSSSQLKPKSCDPSPMTMRLF